MTTAPIPADTKDTITRVSTHPSSPGASAKKKSEKSERLEGERRRKVAENIAVRFSLAPSNRKDPPPFSFAATAKENDDGVKRIGSYTLPERREPFYRDESSSHR